MEKKYSIKEILSAVEDLNNIKKEVRTVIKQKSQTTKVGNDGIPPDTLKLIEEAEKYKKN
tara:strand:- start:784 stop:963 length:180 start_codon:yes stop_codon:yes gene_type:complete